MSEEEKKAIEYMKEFQKDLYGASSKNLMASYLDTIFNLIDKQQKEIEELKFDIGICDKDLDSLNERIYQLKQDNKKLVLGKFREVADKNEYIKSEYISKDKIREKIKELKTKIIGSNTGIYSAQIDILEKLLEE